MGHYESSGYVWEEGETPQCEYCGGQATRSTGTSGVHLCDSVECATQYLEDGCDPIEWVGEEEEDEQKVA